MRTVSSLQLSGLKNIVTKELANLMFQVELLQLFTCTMQNIYISEYCIYAFLLSLIMQSQASLERPPPLHSEIGHKRQVAFNQGQQLLQTTPCSDQMARHKLNKRHRIQPTRQPGITSAISVIFWLKALWFSSFNSSMNLKLKTLVRQW